MQREEVDSPGFVLTAFARVTRHDQPLNLYIEDDGLAWRSRNEPSDAPTPHQALGLALAAVDPAANVVLAHLTDSTDQLGTIAGHVCKSVV